MPSDVGDNVTQSRIVQKIRRLVSPGHELDPAAALLPVSSSCGDRYILRGESGEGKVLESLENGPVSISRLGTTESALVHYFAQNRRMNGCKIPEILLNNLVTLSGFFPASEDLAVRFATEYLSQLSQLDVIGVRWEKHDRTFFPNEYSLISTYSKNAELVGLENVTDPFTAVAPWTIFLKDKKVLVVHPFAKTIREQYAKRDLIFKNPNVLPHFNLEVLEAVQSIANSRPQGFANWFDARDAMIDDMLHRDFDVALIGAGAYGMALATACKANGRNAVHMGGSLQVLFGIKGARWTNPGPLSLSDFVNDSWTNPLPSETPEGYRMVEGGCYW